MNPNKKATARTIKTDKPPQITDATILRLYVVAGGMCSFPGCPAYLLEEPLTKRKARLGNIAHIVGEKEDGPRGNDPLPMAQRSEVENLMLLCSKCHLFVDKKELEHEYPARLLRQFKKAHEDHIRAMTGTALKDRTTAVRMVGQVRGHLVSLPDVDIRAAVFAHEGRHVESIIDIDIGAIPDGADLSYLTIATDKIATELRRRVLPQIEDGTVRRLSVFALSRIPLLCELGYGLGDKVPTEMYQCHRLPHEGWSWPVGTERVRFEIAEHENAENADVSRVAVLIAVSGGDLGKVRRATRAKHIYEIRPVGLDPTRTLLGSPATLGEFRGTYQQLLSQIEKQYPGIVGLDLFLAAPAPVAIMCGRDIARDVVPDVVVHDLVEGEYVAASILKTKTARSLGAVERRFVVAAAVL